MEELEGMFDLKTDLLDYVLENGFHVAEYLKQKALLSIDDSALQKGKGKGRSAAAKEGQGSSKQADKEKRPRERKRDAAAVEVPTDVLHPERYNRLVAWRNAEVPRWGCPYTPSFSRRQFWVSAICSLRIRLCLYAFRISERKGRRNMEM